MTLPIGPIGPRQDIAPVEGVPLLDRVEREERRKEREERRRKREKPPQDKPRPGLDLRA